MPTAMRGFEELYRSGKVHGGCLTMAHIRLFQVRGCAQSATGSAIAEEAIRRIARLSRRGERGTGPAAGQTPQARLWLARIRSGIGTRPSRSSMIWKHGCTHNFQRYPARRRSQARSAMRSSRIKRLRPYLDHAHTGAGQQHRRAIHAPDCLGQEELSFYGLRGRR